MQVTNGSEPDEPFPPPIQAWLHSKSQGGPNTLRAYRADITAYMLWLHGRDYLTIDRATAESWAIHLRDTTSPRTRQPYAHRTRARMIASVASLYEYLTDEGLIEAPPFHRVKRPKVDSTEGVTAALSADQAQRLRDAAAAAGDRSHALIELMLATGLRAGSVAQLRVEHFHNIDGVLWFRARVKGDKTEDMPVLERAALLIEILIGERTAGPLFVGLTPDEAWSYGTIYDTVRRMGDIAGVPDLAPHMLRATFATHAFDAGASVDEVQAMMGHSQVSTTQSYDRGRRSRQRKLGLLAKLSG